ncbi:MAG: amino acid permease, partial [Candidatus Altiarchaeota archaeon]|nr:amino acid permease [Candidatus Altiarchaeota archaeon]
LTWIDGVGIGVGAMIGGGVFTVSALAVEIAGDSAILAFLFVAALAYILGNIYAKLSIRIRSSGGSYSFIQEFMKDKPFHGAYGYLLILAYSTAIGFYANTFSLYASQIFSIPKIILALIPISLFTMTNIRGAKESAIIQNIIVLLKVFILLFFIYLGLMTPITPNLKLIPEIFVASSFIFIAFQGFELIANSAEEMKKASDLPKAINWSIILVTVIYTLVAWSLISLGGVGTGEVPLADAASKVIGEVAYAILFFGAAVATFSATNSTLYGTSRLAFAMAREGDLPKFFSEIKNGLPIRAIFATSIMSIFSTIIPLEQAALLVASTFFLVFVLVSASALATGIVNDTYSYLGIFFTMVPILFGNRHPMLVAMGAFTFLVLIIYIQQTFLSSKKDLRPA